jgi:hypothetical protein
VHPKHLGAQALAHLTDIFNLSVQNANIPVILKQAIIIPVLKPEKSADKGLSYRPISLPSLVAKILERLIKPDVNTFLPKHHTQYGQGYSPLHYTVTVLLPLATQIAIGFNDPKSPRRSALVAIDIKKAFDLVSHTLFIEEICRTDLHSNYIRWLSAYLRGRTILSSYNIESYSISVKSNQVYPRDWSSQPISGMAMYLTALMCPDVCR